MKAMIAVGVWAFLGCSMVLGQSEVSGWGNLRGIRVGGQLVAFTTAVGIYDPQFEHLTISKREGPTHTDGYDREGNTVTVGETLRYSLATTRPATEPTTGHADGPGGSLSYSMSYADSSAGRCDVDLEINSAAAHSLGGVYYFLTLPGDDFANGSAQFIGGAHSDPTILNHPDDQGHYLAGSGTGIRIRGRNNAVVEVDFPGALDVVVKRGQDGDDIQIYFPIITGNIMAGQIVKANFTIKASVDVDTSPAVVSLDASKTGRSWLGMGGNFRIQNPRLDPLHIQYNMDHMRVAYGRVAMPWNVWRPVEDSPPSATGSSHESEMHAVKPAMEMAGTLATQKIPMIISVWSAPSWALLPKAGGGHAQRLDPAKWDSMCQSIGSYLVYLRDHFGAEPELFSFNESNIGIDVRQTPEDHDQAIRELGAYFKSVGLKTKMLLGDTGDAPPVDFIRVAMNDPPALPYIGAISFHSWRGASDAQYQRWADAADRLGVPLFDAEGGNDAQAYRYPEVLREAWYSLDEAAEYVRIMRICEPKAILQWQLTENYSVLSSDSEGRLEPTQRFYNLKQFNLAPAGSVWIGCRSDHGLVLAAAMIEQSTGVCTVHVVNNGASRPFTITGLPGSVGKMNVYVTDHDRGMAESEPVKVSDGSVKFLLAGQALTTLISGGGDEEKHIGHR